MLIHLKADKIILKCVNTEDNCSQPYISFQYKKDDNVLLCISTIVVVLANTII